ncbi:MAG: AarF/ABC1/UbiB kinase family protein [Pseudomonadales bacterium]|nr:AarF/ABC1/UbiB kinase family protein [Pseudomonadales bacterium]
MPSNPYVTLGNTLKGVRRLGQTGRVLSWVGLRWLKGERPPLPRLLRETFEELGATYIKLGQFIASSPSLFPEDYVQEFQSCLDKTEPVSFAMLRRVVEEDLGRPLGDVYRSIDPVPLASASIAQVHAAVLNSGESVVVKIQKPGVANILLTDLNFLYVTARVMERAFPQLRFASLSAIVEEIQACMMEEVDFFKEANNIRQFQSFLTRTGNTQAVVPKVYGCASGRRVLTMERFYGVPLTDLDSIRRYARDPSMTLVTAMNTWFASLTQCESFHADLHAGNLMVLTDGRLGFIDFGIVGRIDPETWKATMQFIESLSAGDIDTMATSMVRIGMTKRQVDIARLKADIRTIYDVFSNVDPDAVMAGAINDQQINRVLLDIVAVGERHGIRFPRAFALLLKQVLYFDRYIKILAPEMNMFDDSRLDFVVEDLPFVALNHHPHLD